ncbi:MAG: hypothetical protein IKZ19_06230 [Clostridia bacterium]|nr:hypothetical protein [Clostridia bacterium]
MKNNNVKKLALTSVLCAVSLGLTLLAPYVSSATVSIVAVAGLFVAVMFMECGIKYAALGYVTVSILSLLLTADKTAACMYIFFFGHYPIYKGWCESMRKVWVEFALKLACFNAALYLCWFIAGVLQVRPELPDIPFVYPLAFILANAIFLLYDLGFSKLISLYRRFFDRRYRK